MENTEARNLIEGLKRLNYKERFHLVCRIMGLNGQTFVLGEQFRADLAAEIGAAVPQDAYVAMDYHLDYIEDALLWWVGEGDGDAGEPKTGVMDVDLLITYLDAGVQRLIMLEAKYWAHWNNRQLQAKANRLAEVFAPNRQWASIVVPSFILISPSRPRRINTENWPPWMTADDDSLRWLRMQAHW